MASEVSISNLALSHLGDDATVASLDPAEGSAQAEHCAMFYPIARDALLEMGLWTFATAREPLAKQAELPDGRCVYAAPNNMLRPLELMPDGIAVSSDSPILYDVETDADGLTVIIAAPAGDAMWLRHTRRITDPNRFSPLFVEALSWLLASYLAGPVMKGDVGQAAAEACYKVFKDRWGHMATSDANRGKQRPERQAPWIGNR